MNTRSDTIPLLSNSHLPLPKNIPNSPIEVLLDLRRDHVGFPTHTLGVTDAIKTHDAELIIELTGRAERQKMRTCMPGAA